MVNGWDGADPVQQDDGIGTVYELGQEATAVGDITITAVRVWHGASSNTVVGRRARLWNASGVQQREIVLTDTLEPGWTTFELASSWEVPASTAFVVSYSTRQFYGATAGGYPNASSDGNLTYTSGVFDDSIGTFPTDETATFYGVDVIYTPGIGGNVSPSVTVEAAVEGRTVTATATVEDESPGTVSYRWEFGDGTVIADGDPVEEHTYAANGIYAVLVTVTDAGGLRDSAAAPVVARASLAGGIDVGAALDDIAARLDTISGLVVFDHVPKRVAALPAALVAFPESITYDMQYRRARDRMDVPVVVLVSRLNDDGARDELSGYAAGFGLRSIKAVLESGVYAGLDALRVGDCMFDVYTVGGTDYLCAVFTVSVVG